MATKRKHEKQATASKTSSLRQRSREMEKRFKLKQDEEIVDMRIVLTHVPVGGPGPRPKREVIFGLTVAQALEGSESRKGTAVSSLKPKTKAKAKAQSLPGKDDSEPDEPKTPVGGKGRKRPTSNP